MPSPRVSKRRVPVTVRADHHHGTDTMRLTRRWRQRCTRRGYATLLVRRQKIGDSSCCRSTPARQRTLATIKLRPQMPHAVFQLATITAKPISTQRRKKRYGARREPRKEPVNEACGARALCAAANRVVLAEGRASCAIETRNDDNVIEIMMRIAKTRNGHKRYTCRRNVAMAARQ